MAHMIMGGVPSVIIKIKRQGGDSGGFKEWRNKKIGRYENQVQ